MRLGTAGGTLWVGESFAGVRGSYPISNAQSLSGSAKEPTVSASQTVGSLVSTGCAVIRSWAEPGRCSRSRLALDEKGHVYDLRASVATLRMLSADEVERWHPVRVDHLSIILMEVVSVQRFPYRVRRRPQDYVCAAARSSCLSQNREQHRFSPHFHFELHLRIFGCSAASILFIRVRTR